MILGKPPLLWINPQLNKFTPITQLNLHPYLKKNAKLLQHDSFKKPSTSRQSGRNYELLLEK